MEGNICVDRIGFFFIGKFVWGKLDSSKNFSLLVDNEKYYL